MDILEAWAILEDYITCVDFCSRTEIQLDHEVELVCYLQFCVP